MTAPLRHRMFDTGDADLDRVLGEFARDVFDSVEAALGFRVVKFTDAYRQPVRIGVGREPDAIVLARAREDARPEVAVAHDVRVSFRMDGATALVDAIGGLTAGMRYRYTFLLVGAS